MGNLAERIQKRLSDLQALNPNDRIGQSWLAKKVGLTAPAVSKWVNGGTKTLEGTNLLKAAKALGVRPEWLAEGRGEMLEPNLGPAVSTPLRPVVVVENEDDIAHDVLAIPRYTVRASAGHGEPVLEIDVKGQPNYCRSGWAKRHGYRPDNLFSIVASGDSMEPTIPNGASLIIHRQDEIASGKIHVLCRGNECFVKRLVRQMDGSILVRSDNRELYSDLTVHPDDSETLYVVGLVVSMSTNL